MGEVDRTDGRPRAGRTGLNGLLRRLTPAILVLGGASLLGRLGTGWPHDTLLALRVSHPQTVRAVSVTWLLDGEAVHGSSRVFADGAPAEIEVPARLARGAYDVEFEVERAPSDTGERAVRARRRVDVGDADRITISLR